MERMFQGTRIRCIGLTVEHTQYSRGREQHYDGKLRYDWSGKPVELEGFQQSLSKLHRSNPLPRGVVVRAPAGLEGALR